jgi:hypothetical protein
MTDKMEALTEIMSNIDNLEKLRDSHKNIAENLMNVTPGEIIRTCDVTADYLNRQIDMLRNLLDDKSLLYETFNKLNYVTEE